MTHSQSSAAATADFVAGVDTHSQTHTLAVLTTMGAVVSTETFPATTAGYQEMITALNTVGKLTDIGVEGTNSYGAGLGRALTLAGYTVTEVLRPSRQVRRMHGKSDPIDAIAAARTLLAGDGLSIIKDTETPAESLRFLLTARAQLTQAMTALVNSIRSLLVTADDNLRAAYQDLSTTALIRALAASRPGTTLTRPAQAAAYSLRVMAKTHQEHQHHLRDLNEQIQTLVAAHYPAVLAIYGAGAVTAAELVVTAGGNPSRIRNEAAFASLCGVCPIPASSGKTHRHRLNHGGDRRGNKALHRIALLRMRHEERTRAYVERKTAQGKTKKEILRCLKRAIAREVYTALTHPHTTLTTQDKGQELARQRKARGLTLVAVAQALNTYPARISDIEKNRRPLPTLTNQYTQWLTAA